MARNVLDAGYAVVAHNRSRGPGRPNAAAAPRPVGPGLGVEPDRSALERYRVE